MRLASAVSMPPGLLQSRRNADGSSFSGKERSHLFVSQGGQQFLDLSGISGVDSIFDARTNVLWDYDRDGWTDIATINTNAPKVELFRNRIGEFGGSTEAGRVVVVRLVGGNQAGQASDRFTNRDGIGTKIRVALSDKTLFRERIAGAGRAAQNSAYELIGIGADETATLDIEWPSGVRQRAENVPEGTLVTFYEDPVTSPDGVELTFAPYRIGVDGPAAGTGAEEKVLALVPDDGARLRLYTTFASWCSNCAAEVPHLWTLDEAFPDDVLAQYAVPIEPKDGAAEFQAWMDTRKPPYRILDSLLEISSPRSISTFSTS